MGLAVLKLSSKPATGTNFSLTPDSNPEPNLWTENGQMQIVNTAVLGV